MDQLGNQPSVRSMNRARVTAGLKRPTMKNVERVQALTASEKPKTSEEKSKALVSGGAF